jgi:hypothetical protein
MCRALSTVAALCIKGAYIQQCFKQVYLLLKCNKCSSMKHELILIVDKLESSKCKAHGEVAKIKIVRGNIEITSCCDKHKRFLERQVEYEIYKLFSKENTESEFESANSSVENLYTEVDESLKVKKAV